MRSRHRQRQEGGQDRREGEGKDACDSGRKRRERRNGGLNDRRRRKNGGCCHGRRRRRGGGGGMGATSVMGEGRDDRARNGATITTEWEVYLGDTGPTEWRKTCGRLRAMVW